MNVFDTRFLATTVSLLAATLAHADVATPSIFGDHMVLQRDQANPVWGWADPGEQVTVSIDDQQHKTKANRQGDWRVTLKPLPAGGPHRLTIKGKNTLEYDDVLVGEVWICSGQSNMQLGVQNTIDRNQTKQAIRSGGFRNIRLFQFPELDAPREPILRGHRGRQVPVHSSAEVRLILPLRWRGGWRCVL